MLLIYAGCVQDHPYRYICDLRKGASDSLVEVHMTQKSADAPRDTERVPEGLSYYEIRAHMRELNVIVLARFLNETLRYIMLLLKLRPAPLSPVEEQEQASKPDAKKKVLWHLQLLS